MWGKRGDVSDGIIIIVTLFFLAIAFLVAAFVNDKLKDVVETTPLNDTEVASTIIDKMDNITSTSIQRGFVMIFAILVIGTMVSSFLVRVHPAFIFVYILFMGFTVFVSIILANTYDMVIENATLAEIANQQTMTNWIMAHIVKIMIGVVALSVFILFAKIPEDTRF